jgi:hypothetical protein
VPVQQRGAGIGFDRAPGARWLNQCQVCLCRAGGDAAGFGDCQEQAQVGDVHPHVVPHC